MGPLQGFDLHANVAVLGRFEDLRRRVPDIGKLRSLLGFAPEYDLNATLDKVIRHQMRGEKLA